MKVTLERLGNISFTAQTESGHRVIMDAAPAVGGENAGPRPMEMVLMGLGGCSGIDVISILNKSRQQVSKCTIELSAERADTIPRVFTHIHVHYVLSGNELDSKKVERAILLSMEKYCSVTRMLEKAASISHDFEIQADPC